MIKIYTDGSCLVNPGGCGGWAFVVSQLDEITISDTTEFYCGGVKSATNNSMELMAILKALEWCKDNQRSNVFIYSDSKYAMNVCNAWSHIWAKNGWKNRNQQPIANPELVKEIYNLGKSISFHVEWVPGHSGNVWNEFADNLANKMAAKFSSGVFAKYSDVDLSDKLSARGKLFRVSAKFISTGTIILMPMFGKEKKQVIVSDKEFDELSYIKI
mgnify:CR=1 FL=1